MAVMVALIVGMSSGLIVAPSEGLEIRLS